MKSQDESSVKTNIKGNNNFLNGSTIKRTRLLHIKLKVDWNHWTSYQQGWIQKKKVNIKHLFNYLYIWNNKQKHFLKNVSAERTLFKNSSIIVTLWIEGFKIRNTKKSFLMKKKILFLTAIYFLCRLQRLLRLTDREKKKLNK